jgi:hypothetical protein
MPRPDNVTQIIHEWRIGASDSAGVMCVEKGDGVDDAK